jgi:hypothetical protein
MTNTSVRVHLRTKDGKAGCLGSKFTLLARNDVSHHSLPYDAAALQTLAAAQPELS